MYQYQHTKGANRLHQEKGGSARNEGDYYSLPAMELLLSGLGGKLSLKVQKY